MFRDSNYDNIDETRAKHTKELMQKANVVGVGLGYKQKKGKHTKQISIVVFVEKKFLLDELLPKDVVPMQLNGFDTDVIESGKFYAQQARTDKWRPAPGGVSIGHKDVTAGTLGCLVVQNDKDKTCILSNNHVLANCNDALLGDQILQPGVYDGGDLADTIAHLEKFIPIDFTGGGNGGCFFSNIVVGICNFMAKLLCSTVRLKSYRMWKSGAGNEVDCAIARPVEEGDVLLEVLDIGKPMGYGPAFLGMNVKKSGRTTKLTKNRITAVNASVTVSYGAKGTALFVDQLITGNMSKGGDSGSVLFNEDNYAVGLLFAGSNTQTIHNRIENVLDKLNIHIKTN